MILAKIPHQCTKTAPIQLVLFGEPLHKSGCQTWTRYLKKENSKNIRLCSYDRLSQDKLNYKYEYIKNPFHDLSSKSILSSNDKIRKA